VIGFYAWLFFFSQMFFKDYLSPSYLIWINIMICFNVIIFVAGLMYLFVEQPFQRLRDHLTLKKVKAGLE